MIKAGVTPRPSSVATSFSPCHIPAMPYYLHVWCICGHAGQIEIHDLSEFRRPAVLALARCSKCGARGQIRESRLAYDAGANQMDGCRTGQG